MGKSTGIPEEYLQEGLYLWKPAGFPLETDWNPSGFPRESWWFLAESQRFLLDYETTSAGILDFMQSKL